MIHKSARVMPIADKIQRTFIKRALPDSKYITPIKLTKLIKTDSKKAEHPHFVSYATKLVDAVKHAVLVDQV